LIIPNAMPCATPACSAPSDSSAMAGAHSIPASAAHTTTQTPRIHARPGVGSAKQAIRTPIRPARSGTIRRGDPTGGRRAGW
jgi:hypothetical protein